MEVRASHATRVLGEGLVHFDNVNQVIELGVEERDLACLATGSRPYLVEIKLTYLLDEGFLLVIVVSLLGFYLFTLVGQLVLKKVNWNNPKLLRKNVVLFDL